jgi:hypothetical protein
MWLQHLLIKDFGRKFCIIPQVQHTKTGKIVETVEHSGELGSLDFRVSSSRDL